MKRTLSPLLLFLATAAAIFYLVQFPGNRESFGFPLDDGWIHATYARNLADHGEFAFNPGEPSTGTTSLLWTILLAGAYKITGDVVFSSLFLGICFLLLLINQWYKFTLCIFDSSLIAFLLVLLAIASGIVLWWTLSGMETILFLALGITALSALARKKILLSAISAGLLILTRPEGALLGILIGAGFLFSKEKAAWRDLFRFSLPFILCLLLYIAWNYSISGALWTSTLAGRRWLANESVAFSHDFSHYFGNFGSIVFKWLKILSYSLLSKDSPVTTIALGSIVGFTGSVLYRTLKIRSEILSLLFIQLCLLLAVICLLPALFPADILDRWLENVRKDASLFYPLFGAPEQPGIVSSGNRLQIFSLFTTSALSFFAASVWLSPVKQYRPAFRRIIHAPLLIFLAWTLLHNVLYAVFIPYPGHAGRYQAVNVLAVILLAGALIRTLTRGNVIGAVKRKGRLILTVILVVFISILGYQSFSTWRIVYFSTVNHINSTHVMTGKWARLHLPDNARAAVFDIGAFGFFSEKYVIDFGGLVNPRAISYLDAETIDKYIIAEKSTHAVMVFRYHEESLSGTLSQRMGFGVSKSFALKPLYHAQFDSLAWRRNVHLTANAYPIVRVYEIVRK